MLPPELPPISNKLLYACRVLGKWSSFFVFGLSALILGIVVLPVMCLVFHPRERFKKYARRLISAAFRFFILYMHFIGIVNFKTDNREKYRHLSSKIVVANHPSLLDVVMLISLIPNADCIAATYLRHNFIVKAIVHQLYILNSDDLDSILQACVGSLKKGNSLIIFPEGSRTPRYGKTILKKGAARVALYSGCNIVPVHIGGTDKFGLGKKDPWTGFNPRERYVYDISMGPEIDPANYRDLPATKAVRAITKDLAAFLFPAKEASVVSAVEKDDEY
jgi:1-acyl-sn-glycerol-3-phosphate acyltransferase